MQTRDVKLPERGVTLRVVELGGSGPLCLIAHATGFCAAPYAELGEALGGAYRVLAYDQRGHGASSKPDAPDAYAWTEFRDDLLALVDLLCAEAGSERIGLGIGHSFGGTAVLRAASLRPTRFERAFGLDPVLYLPELNLAATAVNLQNPMAEGARRRRAVFPSRDAVLDSYRGKALFAEWTERALEAYVACGFVDRDDGQVELACPREVEATVFSRASGSLALFDEVPGLAVPTRILRATRGNFGREGYDRLAALAPDLDVVEYDGTHLFPMETPARAAREILAWTGGA